MKNSAWYHKLWSDKFNELPVQNNAERTWLDMQPELDKVLPVQNVLPNGGQRFFNLLAVITASVVAVATIAYLALHDPKAAATSHHKPKGVSAALFQKDEVAPFTRTFKNADQMQSVEKGDERKLKSTPDSLGVKSSSTALNNVENQTKDAKSSGILAETAKNLLTGGKLSTSGNIGLANPVAINRIRESKDPGLRRSESSAANGRQVKKSQMEHAAFQGRVTAEMLAMNANPDNQLDSAPKSMILIPLLHKLAVVNQTTLNEVEIPSTLLNRFIAANAVNQENAVSASEKNTSDEDKKQKLAPKRTPFFSYGLKFGLNSVSGSGSMLGIFSSIRFADKFYVGPELNYHPSRRLKGSYTRASYFRPDSIAPFRIDDSRRFGVMDIPLNLEYRVSDKISFKGGAFISVPLKQRSVISKIGMLPDKRDTLNNSSAVNGALSKSSFNSGTTGGIALGASYRVKRFMLEAKYLANLKAYHVSTSLGSYTSAYKALQLSVGIQLNRTEAGKRK